MPRDRNRPRRTRPPDPPPEVAAALQAAGEHHRAGRLDEAERRCREVLARDPKQADALHMLALLAHRRGDPAEALRLFEAAAAARPGEPGLQLNLGIARLGAGSLDLAASAFRRALRLRPDWAEAHNQLGTALYRDGEAAAAERSYRAALAAAPRHPDATANLGLVLLELGRLEEAEVATLEATRLKADAFAPWNTLGAIRVARGDREGAVSALRRAVALAPDAADAHFNLGLALAGLGRTAEAIAALERAVALRPDFPRAVAHLVTQRQYACRWAGLEPLCDRVRAAARAGAAALPPFSLFAIESTREEQLACARVRADEVERRVALRFGNPGFPRRKRQADGPVTIGYVSADFRDHPVAHHVVGILEGHDRARFRVLAYADGPDPGDVPQRRRIAAAVDGFTEIRDLSPLEAARRIHADGVDILVDLGTYTKHARPDIPALRPAPVQAAYLGFPGTTGAAWIDYLIADAYVAPPGHQPDYRERLALLPPSYLAYDAGRRPADPPPSRAECGLPAEGPVLCCFNQPYKITPEVFGGWMRLLSAVPDAILWLRSAPPADEALRAEARARGVDPSRLVFAGRVDDPAEYLGRLGHADLFLDTYPYNAHATAADALRAGVPVVTRAGETFASRVGGGLLGSVGLPELVTETADAYAALALRLCRDPAERAELRRRLAEAAGAGPFDPAKFVGRLEGLYETMWARHRAGRPPAPLAVD